MLTAAVTGASGFLGSAVVGILPSFGVRVLAVSRQARPGVSTVTHYRHTPAADLLIHCGETADRARVNAAGADYEAELAATVTALADRFGDAMVYVSSATVYGDSAERPFSVHDPVRAADGYTRSKLRAEEIVLQRGGAVVRPSNLIGKGMGGSSVLAAIAGQLQQSGPLLVRDLDPVRDYLPVDDAAEAVGRTIVSGYRGILNVGSGVGRSVRQLATLALDLVGTPDRQILATAPSGRRSVSILDITETENVLGWSPKRPFEGEFRRVLGLLPLL